MREKHSNTDIELRCMKDIVFLGGLLVVFLYAMGIVQGMKKEEEQENPEQEDEVWEIVKCDKLEQHGDTIISIQTLVKTKRKHGED